MKINSVIKRADTDHLDRLFSERNVIIKLALMQLIFRVIFSLVIYACFDKREGLSAFLGGATAALANCVFVSRLSRRKQDVQANEILIRFYFSELLKVVFTLAIMSFLIIVAKVSIMPFVISYLLAAVVINWLFLLY